MSLISHASKVMPKIIQRRIEKVIENGLDDTQDGFRANRSTAEQICNLKVIGEKYTEHQMAVYCNFIDYKNAWVRGKVDRRAQSGPIKSISHLTTRKMRWFGHKMRYPEQYSLTSTIIHGTAPGTRSRGRPRWTWHEVAQMLQMQRRSESVVNSLFSAYGPLGL